MSRPSLRRLAPARAEQGQTLPHAEEGLTLPPPPAGHCARGKGRSMRGNRRIVRTLESDTPSLARGGGLGRGHAQVAAPDGVASDPAPIPAFHP